MSTLNNTLAAAPFVLALFVALGAGACANHRWMEQQTPEVSPHTMLDRVLRLIDTRGLQPREIALVASLKERRKRSPYVSVTPAEFDQIKKIHERIMR